MSDLFILGKYAGDLKSIEVIDEGTSAYFPDPRCHMVLHTTDGDQISLSYETIQKIIKSYKGWGLDRDGDEPIWQRKQ